MIINIKDVLDLADQMENDIYFIGSDLETQKKAVKMLRDLAHRIKELDAELVNFLDLLN